MSRIDDILSDQEDEEKVKPQNSTQSGSEVEYLMGDEKEEMQEPEDEAVEDDEHDEKDEQEEEESITQEDKTLVGTVEKFFSKINVAAIELQGDLKLGDTIQIESGDEKVKLVVSSMQIDRVDVEAATEGDDIGIKVDVPVKEGSYVYKIAG